MEKLRIFCVTNKEIKYLEKLNLSLAGVGKKKFSKKIRQKLQPKRCGFQNWPQVSLLIRLYKFCLY